MTSEKITIVSIIALTVLECYAMYQDKGDLSTFLMIVGVIAIMGGYQAGKITGIKLIENSDIAAVQKNKEKAAA
jgi:hypothetical protein